MTAVIYSSIGNKDGPALRKLSRLQNSGKNSIISTWKRRNTAFKAFLLFDISAIFALIFKQDDLTYRFPVCVKAQRHGLNRNHTARLQCARVDVKNKEGVL